MCEYLSFCIRRVDDEIFLGVSERSHSECAEENGLAPDSYVEAEWTEDDDGKSLVVRTLSERDGEKDEACYRAVILSRFRSRAELVGALQRYRDWSDVRGDANASVRHRWMNRVAVERLPDWSDVRGDANVSVRYRWMDRVAVERLPDWSDVRGDADLDVRYRWMDRVAVERLPDWSDVRGDANAMVRYRWMDRKQTHPTEPSCVP